MPRATDQPRVAAGRASIPTISMSAARTFVLIALLSLLQPVSPQSIGVGGCKTFNLTSSIDSTLTIRHFSTYFDTTDCLRATVSTYDDFTDMWLTMCQADIRGGGGINITLIPESSCIPHTLLPGETGTFRMEHASCSDNCTSACNCGPTMELPLGRLDEHYVYMDELCDADGTCVEDPVVDVIGLGYLLAGGLNTSVPSAGPSAGPSAVPSASPSNATIIGIGRLLPPSAAPSVSSQPSGMPSASPVTSPSNATIVGVGSPVPSAAPSVSSQPSGMPSAAPSTATIAGAGSAVPSAAPSVSTMPSAAPVPPDPLFGDFPPEFSDVPPPETMASPTGSPVREVSDAPSTLLSFAPVVVASDAPSSRPSKAPVVAESSLPSSHPSEAPVVADSSSPSSQPSSAPVTADSSSPSSQPSSAPVAVEPLLTDDPLLAREATSTPSSSPSSSPVVAVSSAPSGVPSSSPIVMASVSPSSQPSATPAVAESSSPSSQPSSWPVVSASSSPSSQPSASPVAVASSSPSGRPSAAPVPAPTAAAVPVAPTNAPITPWPTASPVTLAPTLALNPLCETTYDDLGNMLTCSAHSDCGGFGPSREGATCNSECKCECDATFCLSPPSGNDKDISCKFNCMCEEECDFEGTYSANKEGDRCGGNAEKQCTKCIGNAEACGPDTDCIESPDGTDAICVGSGICTDYKDKMCDEAYTAVSGSQNNRSKCCPATSGCIKGAMGVIATSTCGAVCGTSCLTAQKNPGNFGESPATMCTYGQRVQNMPYCPDVAAGTDGQFSCTGGNDAEGDNSICCTHLSDTEMTPIDGAFHCHLDLSDPNKSYYGYASDPVCVDADSLTGIAGRQLPICSTAP